MLALQSLDVVVVGRFNPHIIVPTWLVQQGICGSKDVKVNFGFDVESRRGSMSFSIDDFQWQVTDARLGISSKSPQKNPAELVSRVLSKLPHTPVTAVGHNFHYRSAVQGWTGRLPQIGEIDFSGLSSFGEPLDATWSSRLQLAGFVLSINVEQNREVIEVTTNVHRNVEKSDDVVEATQKFRDDQELSNRCTSTILAESVDQ